MHNDPGIEEGRGAAAAAKKAEGDLMEAAWMARGEAARPEELDEPTVDDEPAVVDDDGEEVARVTHPHSVPQAVAEVLAGAAAGAAVGALAGPPGVVVGAVLGSLAGVVADVALDSDQAQAADHDALLDEEIGVIGGHIGDAPANQPPPRVGAFSAAAMGAGGRRSEPSEGPMQNVDEP